MLEPIGDRGAKLFNMGGDGRQLLLPGILGGELLRFTPQGVRAFRQPSPACCQLVERNGADRVGVDEALDLPRDLGLAPPHRLMARCLLRPREPAGVRAMKRLVEHRRLGEQLAKVIPHDIVQACGRHLPGVARFGAVANDQGIHAAAAVVGIAAVVVDAVGQPAPSAADQTTEQVLAVGVPPRPLAVLPDARLRPLEQVGRHDGRHRNADPVLPRPQPARLAAAGLRLTTDQRVPPLGRDHLLLIAVGRPGVGVVGQDLPNARRIPNAATARGRHPFVREAQGNPVEC
jgi:hypothetical protein